MYLLQFETLESISVVSIFTHSILIPRSSPRTFSLLTLALVFPLSFAVLAHSLLTHPLLRSASRLSSGELLLLLLYQLLYLALLFVFSLLSTAAVVFTVASLYTDKPVSFSASLSSVRSIFPRLFVTFAFVFILILAFNLAFGLSLLALLVSFDADSFVFIFSIIGLVSFFLVAHVYISAVWHLASVVSVLEPLQGVAAMRKSRELLRGKTRLAFGLVSGYLGACGIIGGLFRAVVVDQNGSFGVLPRIVFGGALVAVLVVVNLVGLLVQSVFYYVCKGYHHQEIDKSLLSDHLGGYLGEYVPLKSSIQMENF